MSQVHRFCTFYLENYFFGIEVEKVQEVVRREELPLTEVPLAPDVVSGLVNLRGQIVTTIDLRKRFQLKQRLQDELAVNLVVHSNEGPVSFLVDEIEDVVEVSEELFEELPNTLKGISRNLIRGAYKLKNRLLIVLEIEKILDLEKHAQ